MYVYIQFQNAHSLGAKSSRFSVPMTLCDCLLVMSTRVSVSNSGVVFGSTGHWDIALV